MGKDFGEDGEGGLRFGWEWEVKEGGEKGMGEPRDSLRQTEKVQGSDTLPTS